MCIYSIYLYCIMEKKLEEQTKAIKHWIKYGKSEGLITTIKPLEECYQKMISFNFDGVFWSKTSSLAFMASGNFAGWAVAKVTNSDKS